MANGGGDYPPPMANGGGDYPPAAANGDGGGDPPVRAGSPQPRPAVRHVAYRDLRVSAGSLRDRSFNLRSIRVWQTTNDALTRRALIAILEQCLADPGEVGPECLAVVRAGDGEFSAVPESARREFERIYRDSCRPGDSEETCVRKLQEATVFRSLPRGGLLLSPLEMDEGVRTVFTAQIRDSGDIEGRAGFPSDVGFEPDTARPGQRKPISVVPYSPEMCFSLKAEDPDRAKIEPRQREGQTIRAPAKVCMKATEGSSIIKFSPSWWVTPLSAGKLNLELDIEHYVGTQVQNYPQLPRPIEITVKPEPSRWDKFDAFLERATGTANLATGLATAIGALIAAISAWGIWKLFRRRRSSRRARS